jgi:hypothetical protein
VNAAGDVFLSSTVLNGKFTLHLAVGNQFTAERHLRRAFDLLRSAAPAGC